MSKKQDPPISSVQEFKIKGMGDILLIQFEEREWEKELNAFFTFLDAKNGFFKSAKIAIDVGERKVKAVQMADLRDGLAERDIALVAIVSKSKQTVTTARTFGLETDIAKIRVANNKKGQVNPDGGEDALLYSHTLRSGMRVKFAGSVAVIGDINPGAEIVAGGSILVWGCIRGSVMAGAEGDAKATICALEAKPLLLRIADIEAKKGTLSLKPVKIICQNSELIYTTWKK